MCIKWPGDFVKIRSQIPQTQGVVQVMPVLLVIGARVEGTRSAAGWQTSKSSGFNKDRVTAALCHWVVWLYGAWGLSAPGSLHPWVSFIFIGLDISLPQSHPSQWEEKETVAWERTAYPFPVRAWPQCQCISYAHPPLGRKLLQAGRLPPIVFILNVISPSKLWGFCDYRRREWTLGKSQQYLLQEGTS